jgi:hypothetical protein
MLFDRRPAVFTAALVLAACSGLAACDDGSDSAVSTGARPTSSRSASESTSYAPSSAQADARAVAASSGPGAVASASPASTATAKADFSTPTTTPTPALAPTPASSTAACTNLAVPAHVKSAVTQAWERSKGISHIRPKPGSFYYGGCGPTSYAAVRFEAGAGATGDDLVHLQDEGSGLQFFRSTPSTGWRFVRSDTFPATRDCSQGVPVALARQWNCS